MRPNPAASPRIAQRVEHEDGERVKALTEEELRRLIEEFPEKGRLFFRARCAYGRPNLGGRRVALERRGLRLAAHAAHLPRQAYLRVRRKRSRVRDVPVPPQILPSTRTPHRRGPD